MEDRFRDSGRFNRDSGFPRLPVAVVADEDAQKSSVAAVAVRVATVSIRVTSESRPESATVVMVVVVSAESAVVSAESAVVLGQGDGHVANDHDNHL